MALFCVAAVGCFDGRAALGLPCEQDFQCGNDQVCAQGVCRWPGDLEGTSGGTGSGSSFSSSSATMSGPGTETDFGSTGGGSNPVGPLDQHQYCADGETARADRSFVAQSLEGSPNSMAVGVGDFAGRGAPMIATVARRSSTTPAIVELFERSSGEYLQVLSAVQIEDEPMDAAAADIDRDGFDDLAVVFENHSPFRLRILWGSENGLLLDDQSAIDLGDNTAYSVTVGDLVEGGNLEIVAALGDQGQMASMVQVNDDRTLRSPSTVSGVSASPWDAVTVDLDGEPPAEVLIAASNDGAFTDFEGIDEVRAYVAPTGALSRELSLTLPIFRSPYGVDAGDVDGDGLVDLVVVGKNIEREDVVVEEESDLPSEFSVCIQRDDGGFECERQLAAEGTTGFNNLRLGDFDCDGNLDAFIGTSGGTAPGDGESRVVWGPLTADSVSEVIESAGPIGNRTEVADVDDDGQPEIVVSVFGAVTRVYDVGGGS